MALHFKHFIAESDKDWTTSNVDNTEWVYYLGSTSSASGGVGGFQYSWETWGTNSWSAESNYLYIYLANGNG